MIIQHNMSALNANRMNSVTGKKLTKSTEKLSSGYKINRAADDAAGLSISEKMRSQIRGLNRASDNAQDGVSLIQVAEGALNEVHSMLQRMNELTIQAANDTNTTVDKDAIKKEIDQLAYEIDRTASTTQFNTMNLLDGTFKDKKLQVGALADQEIELKLYAMDAHGLGLNLNMRDYGGAIDTMLKLTPSIDNIGAGGDETCIAYPGYKSVLDSDHSKKSTYNPKLALLIDPYENACRTMKLVQNSIDLVSDMRSALGATQNRLEYTIANLDNISENAQAAESRIRDTDMAKEMVEYSAQNIINQAGQSMLSQANHSIEGVLSLLQ